MSTAEPLSLLPEAPVPQKRRPRHDLPELPTAFWKLAQDERHTTMECLGMGNPWRVMLPPNSLLLRVVLKHPEAKAVPWESPTGERMFEVPASWVRIVPRARDKRAAVPMPDMPKRVDGALAPVEVAVSWSEADDFASVYTTEVATARRLCRFGFTPEPGQAGVGLSFIVPIPVVKIRPKREVSEKRRAALAEQMAKVRTKPLVGSFSDTDAR